MASETRNRSALIVSALIALVAVTVLGVAVFGSDGEPEPVPLPTAAPEPEPEPPPPVRGEAEVAEIVDLSVTGTGLYRAGTAGDAAVEVDDAAVAAFAEDLTRWLDDHLTDLQDGGEGAATAAGLTGPSEVVHLTDPEHPVETARYSLRIGVRGTPEWGEAEVVVVRVDGSELTATLAFLPGADAPRLVAAEGEGSRPAPPAEETGAEAEEGA